jgi:hypothetical protein
MRKSKPENTWQVVSLHTTEKQSPPRESTQPDGQDSSRTAKALRQTLARA